MSLARAMLRLITVQALTGATGAGDRVRDSSLDPIDARATSEDRAEIVVYTDDHESETSGRAAMLAASSVCELVIEIVVTGVQEVWVDGQDGPAQERLVIPRYDEGLAFTLDMLERQVIATLATSPGPWARLWRDFVVKVEKRLSRQGGAADQATRFAARQLVLSVDLLHEPTPAQQLPPGSTWIEALDLMDQSPELRSLARIIRSEITGDGGPEWRIDAGRLGVNPETMRDLGTAPPEGGDEAVLAEVLLGRGETDPVAVDTSILGTAP